MRKTGLFSVIGLWGTLANTKGTYGDMSTAYYTYLFIQKVLKGAVTPLYFIF
jgi:hypothetical protein